MSKKFFIRTFGCQMNKHDSERMAGMLLKEGYAPAKSPQAADVIVFNTCCVRRHAEERLYGNVNVLKSLKKERPDVIIAVGGCLPQKYGEEVLRRAPHVDVVFGTHNLPNLPKLIRLAERNSSPICEIWPGTQTFPTELPSLREKRFQAWVPITIGCNNFCSYCVVPYVRGRETSRPIQDICREVRDLAEEGVIEITLLGQNVNSYGRDLYGRSRFAALLRELNKIEEVQRIRFTTSHPKDLSDEIIEAVAECDKVCEHIHLPFQAGSDKILKAMNRSYTKQQYLEITKKIREKIPGVSITTDIMVGFPGETEEDFQETLDVVRKVRFDQAFTFIYSPRPGTPAAEMGEQIPEKVKMDRFNQLVSLQNRVTLEESSKMVGKSVEVLVENVSKKDPRMLTGRTRSNKVVHFPGSKKLINQIVQVIIGEAHPWHLIGEVVIRGQCSVRSSELEIQN
ncbi:MAG: tRNA (N6-isopentenyl adenosine(37)-C2)-methylthiotransferase MiaB [Actinomycetota bacterium]|nr:tRNA (N6-isopentenyl adenosine(37)-C2)-methylthiotransferase MiaB [Actinomycetota bacterium]